MMPTGVSGPPEEQTPLVFGEAAVEERALWDRYGNLTASNADISFHYVDPSPPVIVFVLFTLALKSTTNNVFNSYIYTHST